jgi:hypothetical protein
MLTSTSLLALMMMPAFSVLAISLIVGVFEHKVL